MEKYSATERGLMPDQGEQKNAQVPKTVIRVTTSPSV